MTRNLDALFAERVLGLTLPGPVEIGRWTYTTSLDAAWQGVEKLGIKSFSGELCADGWCWAQSHPMNGHWGVATTLPHAIVLACLRAVGVTEQEIDACES